MEMIWKKKIPAFVEIKMLLLCSFCFMDKSVPCFDQNFNSV